MPSQSVDKQIRKSHLLYVSDVIGASLDSGNAKPFWRYIKSKGQQMFGVAALSSHSGLASKAEDKAEILSAQFKSVFTTEDTSTQPSINMPEV